MPRKQEREASLELRNVVIGKTSDGIEELTLQTNAGEIPCIFHSAPEGAAGVVWVGGAGGGLDGPAWGLYPRLASQLVRDHIASLRLHYRHPNNLMECVLDPLLGAVYLGERGRTRVALVGHSFGGAVVITAGGGGGSGVGGGGLR